MNRLGNVRTLIVDDHRNMRSLWRGIMLGFGIRTVYEADSAEAGFQCIAEQPVDLMIIDHHLETLTGAEFLSMVRKARQSPAPHIPAIACTADTRRSTLHTLIDAGYDEILAKPVSAEHAWQKICMVVNSRRNFIRAPLYFGPDRRRKASPYMGVKERRVVIQSDCFVD